MASEFMKKFDTLRNRFNDKTKQWPQMKLAADGHEKSTGIGDDLKKLDTAIDKEDFAALTEAYNKFDKHARTYAQQIDAKPGEGILAFLAKKGEVDERTRNLIVSESKAFGKALENLINEVDVALKFNMAKVSGRKDKMKVLDTAKAEALSWAKYAIDPGVQIVTNDDYLQQVPNPDTNQPSQAARHVRSEALARLADLQNALDKIKIVDTHVIMASSMRKSMTTLDEQMEECAYCSLQLVNLLQDWVGTMSDILEKYRKAGNPHPKDGIVRVMMTRVETSKQSVMKWTIKISATQKVVKALLQFQ